MPAGSEGIQIPVSLQVDASGYLSIIDKLKQSLNKLAPDSKLYSVITKDLQRVEKEANAIQAALAQGFNNPTQLERFNQRIVNFGERIHEVAQEISKANFEDLNLNLVKPEDLQKLNLLKDAVNTVQQRVNNFQTDQMRDVVKQSQDMKEAFDTLKLDVDTSDYTQAMKKANDQIDKLRENAAKKQQILTSKENALQKAQRAKELGSNLKKFIDDKDARTDARYFRADNEFKKGGKEAFFEDLSELGISPQLLQKVKSQSLSNLNQFYKELQDEINKKGLNFKINEKIKDLQDEVNIATTENRAAQVDVSNVEKLRTTLQELNNLDPASGTEFAQKYQQVQEALQNVIAEYENYKKQIRDTTQLDENSAVALEQLKKENQELRAEIAQVKQGMLDHAEAVRAADAAAREAAASQQRLTNAIRQWFSFREVINLTKRAIKDAVTHIKELDATMTQIAVVTNMTQSDLWDQIGTYSAIAQQYGVTTNGVYEVSQLYYQMLVGAR